MTSNLAYFAYGTTLANMTALSAILREPPSVLDTGAMMLMGSTRTRLMSGRTRRDGDLLGAWTFGGLYPDEVDALVYGIWGGYTVGSIQLYISTIDASGHYSPYLAYLDQPTIPDDGRLSTNVGRRDVRVMLRAAADGLQYLTKTSNYTVGLGDRLIYADTSGGNITFALPALSTVTANTVYSFVKTSASNSMILDGNGAELVAGSATQTFTTLNTRYDIIKNDAGLWVTITA